MKYEELKHRIDGMGRYKLSWNWVEKKRSQEERDIYERNARAQGKRGKDLEMPAEFYFNYWATFDKLEDAQEYYERYVKPHWPEDVKWEITDGKSTEMAGQLEVKSQGF